MRSIPIVASLLLVTACGKDKDKDQKPPAPPTVKHEAHVPGEVIRMPTEVVHDKIGEDSIAIELPKGMRREPGQGFLTFDGPDRFAVTLERFEWPQPDGAPALDEAFIDIVLKGMMDDKVHPTTRRVLSDAVLVTWTEGEHRRVLVNVFRNARAASRSWQVRCKAEWSSYDPMPDYDSVRVWTEQVCLSLKL
jgi:hypothetical protein